MLLSVCAPVSSLCYMGFCNVHDAGCNSGFELLYNRFSLLHECIMRQKINLWKHNWKSSWICRLWIFSLTNVVFYKVRLKTWPKSLTLKCNGITSFKPVFCQRLVKVDFSVLVQGLHLDSELETKLCSFGIFPCSIIFSVMSHPAPAC